MSHKPCLHYGDHIRIFEENRFELVDVLKGQLERRIRVRQVCIGGGSRSIIVGKADDQLQASASGSGEHRADIVEAVWIERLGAVVIQTEVDPDQRIGG